MARNGAGAFSTINTFASGAIITATGHNQNWSDLATEMTNSVAADGQTTMTGQLKASNGTAAAPGISFAADLDTGIYHSGSNECSIAVGGAQTAKVSSSGIDAVAGKILEGGNSLIPAGVMTMYAASSAPSGWLLCDGSSLDRTTYAALFSAIGTTFGSADGTHFNIPDLRGRVPAGVDGGANRLQVTTTISTTNTSTSATVASAAGLALGMSINSANVTAGTTITAISGTTITMSGAATATASGTAVTFSPLSSSPTLGASGGEQNHTNVTYEMPAHGHTLTDPGHTHGLPATTTGGASAQGSISVLGSGNTTASATTGITMSNTGSGGAHNNVQPTMVVNFIIKT